MLKKSLILVALFGLSSLAHASVNIVAQALSPNLILSSSGTALAVGDVVEIGYFSSTTNLSTSNSYSSLSSIFTPIGQGSADSDTLSEPGVTGDTMEINNVQGAGTFGGTFQNVSSTYLPAGSLLYMWVFNSTNPATATQWTILGDSTWIFPVDPSQANLSLSSSGITVYRGSTSSTDFELANIPASVPEPTSLAGLGSLLVLGSAAFIRRRKAA
jgi:hypothetical protein